MTSLQATRVSMNTFTQTPPTASGSTGFSYQNHPDIVNHRSNSERMLVEKKSPMPVPVGIVPRPFGASMPGGTGGGLGPMGMPRSPPKNKNTQHVPCKFFVYGQCQAGQTCPFSHDLESTTRPAPCKYFAKGSCKFGRKCALLHITSDGTVVNRGSAFSNPATQGAQQPTAAFAAQTPPPGLLAQGLEQRSNGDGHLEFEGYQYGPRNSYDIPQVDMNYISASPQFGSPTQDGRFAGSPPGQGLSVLDVPLPNSFDSNGVSMAARNGPFAASVPTRFEIDSPPASLPQQSRLATAALQNLRNSAFGDRGMDGVLAGSSPPNGSDEPLTFPKRALFSERLAPSHMISTSLGTKLPTQAFEYSDDEEGPDTDREEDLLPAALHDLIPEGRSRRESRSRNEEDNNLARLVSHQRRNVSGQGTPQDSKVGSPHSSSPSRFTSMFARRPENDATGHFGSPLRNSGFAFASPSSSLPRPKAELSPTVSSPPRQASMSMLTQELQRTKLDAARSQANATNGVQRAVPSGSTGRVSFDRAVSGQGLTRGRIDEEQEVFDMDEVGDQSKGSTSRNALDRLGDFGEAVKSYSSSPNGGEPKFGAIGGHRTSK